MFRIFFFPNPFINEHTGEKHITVRYDKIPPPLNQSLSYIKWRRLQDEYTGISRIRSI